ncbi:Fatty acid cis/trans isomerase (CTI) [Mariprofundus aestuarium]|uniref:Fatty acid cis/trans isomerase (CTI) n=1 Tax=Mariprofundus aestuarium TaxID=1921086 RepID=A0A2K8KWQ3_MARES|nr:fatty acid cis/trans isomerase [Mariprofundus aestuarium]ATX79340.1 Fatty acid cis/trans isomerase (CTI) [Mariprofundus aestuarium]
MIFRIKPFSLQKNGLRAVVLMPLAALLIFSACAKQEPPAKPMLPVPEVAARDLKLIESLPENKLTFNDIRPVLEKRCIVCHGCYDAPCQLKLTSFEGIERGANKLKVYNKKRFTLQKPTRLFIDANSKDEWREKQFFSVLNESGGDPRDNLKNSLIYQMLNLKRENPFPESGKLPQDYENPKDGKDPRNLDVSLDRAQQCTRLEAFGDFSKDHKSWGMPFAVPNLSENEYRQLVQWLAQGAKFSEREKVSSAAVQIEEWEGFFNGSGVEKRGDILKRKLVSRYIYEHLVLGHLHFKGAPEREFFRLVRSTSKPGEPIEEIPSVRPYDQPMVNNVKVDTFYYRLRPYRASIVDKSHIVYELSDARMKRYKELFLGADYKVTELPAYNSAESLDKFKNFVIRMKKLFGFYENHMITPFKVFEKIPARSRYQFLLDDARFFINGFIKGPVCRGLGALSSIEDHFWVFFLKPENPPDYKQHGLDEAFIASNDTLLHLPTELGNTHRLFTAWLKYWPKEQAYMQAKLDYYTPNENRATPEFPLPVKRALDEFVWDGINPTGATINRNSALTVFRHLDSASVHYGLIGDEPETAWMIDYPVFERLHYLLVAGYNTFGTLGHQASARLYMDFLRMEGEDNFLFFLPVDKRKELYESWHNVDRSSTRKISRKTSAWLDVESVSGYKTKSEQHELYALLREHVVFRSPDSEDLNRCNKEECFSSPSDRAMQKLADMKGKYSKEGRDLYPLRYFPALSYVRIGDESYTVIYNKSYKLYEKDSFTKEVNDRTESDMSGDTLTVTRGLAGAYPNFFFNVPPERLDEFIAACESLQYKEEGFEELVNDYGIRRTNPKFWEMADWFKQQHETAQPVESGILDLSRYVDPA